MTNIVCFGDSITQASGVPELDRWPTALANMLEVQFPGAYKVYNRGFGGHTSVQGYDLFPSQVLPLLPAIVLIEFGFNDAVVQVGCREPRVSLPEFDRKLCAFDKEIRAKKGLPIFLLNHTEKSVLKMGDGSSYTKGYLKFDKVLRKTVKSLGAHSIDLPAMMKKRRIKLKEFLVPDGIHLSESGNHAYAEMVLDGLLPVLSSLPRQLRPKS